MFAMNSTKIGKVGNFPMENRKIIEYLAAEHDRIAAKMDALPMTDECEEEFERLNKLTWAIRAIIAATPSKSQSELHAKTHIFEVEAARDPDFECHVAGSARDLARSIAADVMALKAAA